MSILDLDDGEMGYLAGILDGEGSVSLHGRGLSSNGYMTPSIQVTNTDKRLIDWLHEVLGGKVYSVKNDPTDRRRQVWLWCIFGARAREVLTEVEPYLRLKGEQARVVLRLKPNPKGQRLTEQQRAERMTLMAEVRELNRRGAP